MAINVIDIDGWDRAVQEQTKLEGRRSTVQVYSFLLVLSIIFLGAYVFVYISDEDNILKFGMTWAFVCMLIMYAMDFVASGFILVGITRDIINDVLVTLGLVMLSFGCVINFAVFFALPSEDEYGEPVSWLPQKHYPSGCYYRYRGRGVSASQDCGKLRRLATAIWCSFIIFFIRVIILALTKCTISYAKYGAPYEIVVEPPPPAYVISPQPYYPYGYGYGYQYPVAVASTPYVVQYQTRQPIPVVRQNQQGDSSNGYRTSLPALPKAPPQAQHRSEGPHEEVYRVQSMSESHPSSSDEDDERSEDPKPRIKPSPQPQPQQQRDRRESDKPRFSYSSRRTSSD